MNQELKSYARALAKPIDELLDANAALRDDIHRLLDVFNNDWNDQTFRRLLVRTCWAQIEAVVFSLKQATLTACTLGSEELSVKTIAFLKETTIVVNSTGQARIEFVRTDTLKNIKLALKLASKYFDVAWKPNVSAQGWSQLRESLELRHRLTHPKSALSLFVEDSEAEAHRDAYLWFSGGFNDFLESLQTRHGA